jgi:glucan phosphoethanolaminetransferase (alkaline phosphatase superfamily)
MRKFRDWLEKHGAKLLMAVCIFLISSGIVGQLRGRNAVLVTDRNLPGQVKYSPVWWLYVCATLLILMLVLVKRNARKQKKKR